MDIAYRFIKNNGLPQGEAEDDYTGIDIYIDGVLKSTFTGFCPIDVLREFFKGKGFEL